MAITPKKKPFRSGKEKLAAGESLNRFQPTVSSRPTGTDPSRNVDITNLSEQQKRQVQIASATEGKIIAGVQQRQLESQIQQRLIGEEIARQEAGEMQQPEQRIPINNQQEQAAGTEGLGNILRQQQQKQTGKIPTVQESLAQNQQGGAEQNFVLSNIGEGIDVATNPAIVRQGLSAAANLISSLSSILPSDFQIAAKKSPQVQQAESTFIDASNVINQDIEMVRLGQKNPADVLADIDAASRAVNTLGNQVKGTGKLQLRYWIDEGREIEASVLREQRILENQLVELQQAQIEARVNKANASLRFQ